MASSHEWLPPTGARYWPHAGQKEENGSPYRMSAGTRLKALAGRPCLVVSGFKKEERLCSRAIILRLVKKGSSFLLYPFRIVSYPTELPTSDYPVQVVISVSRRRFKKASDRNRIKRQVREVYRKHKSAELYAHLHRNERSLALMISYVGKEILPSPEIEKKLILALKRLREEYDQKSA